MKVSVIVAAYNIEKYIDRCLMSIINQTLKDLEVIVINDGSTDNTLDKITKMANRDKRIKVINQENSGSIEARKTGLKEAKGEYILFVDGDDWLEINGLELLYNKAIKNNSDIVIYDAYLSYDNRKEKFKTILNTDLDEENYVKNLFLGNISPCMWSKFVRREFLSKSDIKFPNDISFAEDLATIACWFINRPKVSILNEYLYNYYQREGSISKTKNVKILEIDKAMEFIKDLLIEKNIYSLYKGEFEYLIYSHMFQWFLEYTDIYPLNIKLYQQYKNRNININSNEMIKNKIDTYPLSLKIRAKSYHKSYKIGKLYDRLRGLAKIS